MDITLFGRYFLDLSILYPGAFLCLAPLWEHLKAPRRTALLTAFLVTVIDLAAAALCTVLELNSNMMLLPIFLTAFWLLLWRVESAVSTGQTAFLFSLSAVMIAVCNLLSIVLNARAEVNNDAPVCLVSTALLKLGLSAVLCILFWFTAVQWSRWLLREYRGEAFWQSAWPLPAIYAAFLMFCMPLDPGVILINRLMIISVLAVSISLLGIFLLLYEMYQVAREYTRSAQLDRENQLLAVESRRYTELRAYMEQTRHLRHDFLHPALGGLLDLRQMAVQLAAGQQVGVRHPAVLLEELLPKQCVFPMGNRPLLGRQKVRQVVVALSRVCDLGHIQNSFPAVCFPVQLQHTGFSAGVQMCDSLFGAVFAGQGLCGKWRKGTSGRCPRWPRPGRSVSAAC